MCISTIILQKTTNYRLEESSGLLFTPYERNIQVWRQLWRVVERADLLVQIVDARNPLLFRSTDFEAYVKEVDPRKKNLLLINKADMLSDLQRLEWANYFEGQGIQYRFFSAALAKKIQEDEAAAAALLAENLEVNSEIEQEEEQEEEDKQEINQEATVVDNIDTFSMTSDADQESDLPQETPANDLLKIKILNVEELLDLFLLECPKPLRQVDTKSTIGFIGYPNVGKSSTLNALAGAKCVAVASTPGKTKHFQVYLFNIDYPSPTITNHLV